MASWRSFYLCRQRNPFEHLRQDAFSVGFVIVLWGVNTRHLWTEKPSSVILFALAALHLIAAYLHVVCRGVPGGNLLFFWLSPKEK